MSGPADKIIDLIYGRWRSQILYVGVELGVFDHLAGNRSKQADTVAAEIGADEKLLYRLMRIAWPAGRGRVTRVCDHRGRGAA
jgi:hypothetical protein